MVDCKMLPQKTMLKNFMMHIILPPAYWRSKAAVTRLVEITGVPKSQCITWLSKQTIWQICLPKLYRKITYARIKDDKPNTHQADLLYLPEDGGYKFALCVVDVASRYKEAEPLKTRT